MNISDAGNPGLAPIPVDTKWDKSNIQIFWGEIAPSDHLVQIYENEKVFMNTLEGFVGDGFIRNESIIVVATPDHLTSLKERMQDHGFDIDALEVSDQFIAMSVDQATSAFMVNDWPDENLFSAFIGSLMTRAQKNNHKQ